MWDDPFPLHLTSIAFALSFLLGQITLVRSFKKSLMRSVCVFPNPINHFVEPEAIVRGVFEL